LRTALSAIAADLAPRCDAIVVSARRHNASELDYQRDIALQTVQTVRHLAADAVAGTDDLDPEHYGAQLRRLRTLNRLLDEVEWYVLPCLERFTESDRRLTLVVRKMLEEAGWKAWAPTVLTWSRSYFSAAPRERIINVCAGEQERLLRLPDIAHEFGHCLYDATGDKLTKPLLVDLMLWSSEADDEAQAEFRDMVEGLWSEAWLAEFTCDAIGTFITGPSYARQHFMLTARMNVDPYGHVPSHPSPHARATGIAHVLRLMDLNREADAFWARWLELCRALEQPVADEHLGAPAVKDEYFWSRYPTDADGRRFIHRVADLTLEGLTALGMARYAPDQSPDETVAGLIDQAWRRYEADPGDFGATERDMVTALLARLGV
jgi:hypothetical protein